MARITLNTKNRNEIINLLRPFFETEKDRLAIINQAFLNHPLVGKVDLSGAPNTFLSNLLNTLISHGEIEPNKQAIYVLLQTLIPLVGVDVQDQIIQIQNTLEKQPSQQTQSYKLSRNLSIYNEELHERYLLFLFNKYNVVKLASIFEGFPREGFRLSEIYVPLKLDLQCYLEVKDGELIDWWFKRSNYNTNAEPTEVDSIIERTKQLFNFHPQHSDLLGEWKNSLALSWQKYKKAECQNRSLPISDGVYPLRRIESEMAVALSPYLVISGDPGTGKSSLIRYLALCLAGEMLINFNEVTHNLNLEHLKFWPLIPFTPILVELRDLVGYYSNYEEISIQKFHRYLESNILAPNDIAVYIQDLKKQMIYGEVIFLFDGLDEVPQGDTREQRQQIQSFIYNIRNSYPKCRIVITSRPYAYQGAWKLDGFDEVSLIPLDVDRLRNLSENIFRTLQLKNYADEVVEFTKRIATIPLELRSNPLFFTLIIAIWISRKNEPANSRLPVKRATIYRECVEMLIRRWTYKDLDIENQSIADLIKLTSSELREMLEKLAYEVHKLQGGQLNAIFTAGKITDTLVDMGIRDANERLLRESLSYRTGIIHEKSPNRFQFSHLSFQEHLAACFLLGIKNYPDLIIQHIEQTPRLWHNVFELLVDEAKIRNFDLWKLVRSLLAGIDFDKLNDHSIFEWNRILYAAKLVMDVLKDDHDLQTIYRPKIITAIIKLLECSALDSTSREEMGKYLSELGDSRKGVGVIDGIPDIDWVLIPESAFLFGSDPEIDPLANVPEIPQEKIHLPKFYISRFDITNIQFQSFIDDPNGYKNIVWWEGLSGRQEEPGLQTFQYANHPRENVSWYDAVAFCRWLSYKVGYTVRLPTEQEWEKAARGTNGLIFPYGNEFDSQKGNTFESGIGQTTCVGLYPMGASPYGILDMSGNVWNWTLSKWTEQIRFETQIIFAGDEMRIGRGGSWGNQKRHARTSRRSSRPPYYRGALTGFRVACESPHLPNIG